MTKQSGMAFPCGDTAFGTDAGSAYGADPRTGTTKPKAPDADKTGESAEEIEGE